MLNIVKLKKELSYLEYNNRHISLIFKNHVTSTNDYLRYEYVKDICPVIISTYSQRASRGRKGRKWKSLNQQSISFSFCICLDVEKFDMRFLSFISCVSLLQCIQEQDNRNFKIKWPNDIIINNQKVSGILIESYSIKKKVYLSIGIGININLSMSKNEGYSRSNIKSDVDEVQLITSYCKKFLNNMINKRDSEIIQIYNDNLFGYQSKVEIISDVEKYEGVLLGINNKGQLQLKLNNATKYIEDIDSSLRVL